MRRQGKQNGKFEKEKVGAVKVRRVASGQVSVPDQRPGSFGKGKKQRRLEEGDERAGRVNDKNCFFHDCGKGKKKLRPEEGNERAGRVNDRDWLCHD